MNKIARFAAAGNTITHTRPPQRTPFHGRTPLILAVLLAFLASVAPGVADETCNSPYITALIKGQEEFLHVWTLGIPGVGDGADKLVTVDVKPSSRTYGQVVHVLPVGGRGEAHHMGFTDDRKHLWAGRLADNKIFVFDVGNDPAQPRLVKTISDLGRKSGYLGPHTFYALPGRMLVGNLSNVKDRGGVTGMAVYRNDGRFVAKYAMPRDAAAGADGYGYDIAVNPQKNVLLTSSFAGAKNYLRPLGELVKDAEAMKQFGHTMVLWDLKAMTPRQIFQVPGAPLEIRWSLHPGDSWAITATALTAKLWLVRQDNGGQWQAKEVGSVGDPAQTPLPVDISITANGKGLWVNTFGDGKTRYFDLSDPEHPRQTYERTVGKQVNMISQSWDGRRLYITSSLLANWDKSGADGEQFLRAFYWDGSALTEAFAIDFLKAGLGRPHHMKFTARTRLPVPAMDDVASRR